MNYWLIIRLPILFAIGVSDAVGWEWELLWARVALGGGGGREGVLRGPPAALPSALCR